MAGASAGKSQNILRPGFKFLPVGKEQYRIEISLHRALEVHQAPALIKRNAPVEADHFSASFFHRRQQGSAVGAEIDNRHASGLELLHETGHMSEHISSI